MQMGQDLLELSQDIWRLKAMCRMQRSQILWKKLSKVWLEIAQNATSASLTLESMFTRRICYNKRITSKSNFVLIHSSRPFRSPSFTMISLMTTEMALAMYSLMTSEVMTVIHSISLCPTSFIKSPWGPEALLHTEYVESQTEQGFHNGFGSRPKLVNFGTAIEANNLWNIVFVCCIQVYYKML